MTYLLVLVLVGLILYLLFFTNDKEDHGKSRISGVYIKLLLVILALTLGALIYPKLNEKLNIFKSKLNNLK